MARTLLAALALVFGIGLLAQTPPPAPEKKDPPAPEKKDPPAEKPKDPMAPAPQPPMATTPPATTQFQLKLEKNKPFFQKLSTDVKQSIKVQGGADLAQNHQQTFFFKWMPVEQVGDKWTLKQTIEGAKMTIDIAGNQVKYDSTAGAETGGGNQPGLSDFFSKLVGSEFTVTYGKGMVVEKVDGRDEFLKKLGGVNNQMENILKKMLTEDALKQMVDPSFGLSPPNEIAVNGTWEKKTNMSLGPIGSYEMTTKYAYKGKDPNQKEFDRIDVAVSLKYAAPTDQQEGLLFKIKGGTLTSLDATPEMAAKNFILYDPKVGRVVSSSMVVKMKGSLNVSIGGTDTTVELNQEQTTTVETRDTTFLEPKK